MILGVALLLRALLPVASAIVVGDPGVYLYPDSTGYLRLTHELLRSGRFASAGRPEVDRTPGYSMLLLPGTALGRPVLVTIAIQVVLSVLTVFLVYRTSLLLLEDENPAAAAALLYSLEPLSILYASLMLTETLFALLLVISAYLFAVYFKGGRALGALALAAVSLAASVYVRPVSYYLPFIASLVLLLVALVHLRKLRYLAHASVFAALAIGLIAVWQVRNRSETGYGGFSAISEVNLYFYQAASVRARQQGLPYLEMRHRMGYTDPELYFAEHPEQRSWSDAQRYRYMGQEGVRTILANPGLYAAIHLNGIVRILFDPGAVDFLKVFGLYPASGGMLGRIADHGLVPAVLELAKSNPPAFWAQGILFLLLAAYYLLAAVGVLGDRASSLWARIAMAAVVVYFVAVSGGPHSYSRFRHPVMPFLCVLAGYGCLRLLQRFGERPLKPAAVTAGAGRGDERARRLRD